MQTNASPVGDENRRRALRARTLKGGKIIFSNGYSVFDCTIRNLSDSGALLTLSNPLGVPSHFDLAMGAAKPRRPCSIRWRTDKAIGVSFDDADSAAA